ncbi:MAG: hypothetical protein COT38_01210 [Candidatus Omnitrophica bacterium CG08_land_8_20_14_0_20_41_16]|uniref:Carbamoyltransferase n=1 Tax=Candidatus Sherwoodlollariibacterium unditelluris TaxID=1974757 RepID=A0A2G9YI99_9BACT|nr:MAG: hypothetical protein COX41_05415 [Candidatus Omnitrophica bacterium CG23_combo_of_CG06-09_8_20_14_all_41_10]PIS34231.1 MAG: hypothetical protein COT38_01210 [Candidatus Omnitrophica bacterium CG08_land_8_20_14_0_20_41_16]
MNILGISCFYHDSAASLVRDGEISAAAQEERFSRKKYDPRFPFQAINYCLTHSGIKLSDIDCLAFYADNLKSKFKLTLNLGLSHRIKFFSQGDSYLASAYYPSPFKEAVILVNGSDVGVVLGKGERDKINSLKDNVFKSSLGLTYSLITRYLGFNKYGDEFKVMGLAAYGKPKYKDIIQKHSEKSMAFLPKLKQSPDKEITQLHMDIAASLQVAVEEEALKVAEYLYKIHKYENLCLSGDMALNCLINARILEQGLFKHIWIQPAATAAGASIGAALLAWYRILNNERDVDLNKDTMSGSLLGPAYSDEYIESFLKNENIAYKRVSYEDIPKVAAELIANAKIIGWFQGKMEFGPRALGNRSILADPRDMRMHKKINLEVKRREPFRPFAPTVLWEKAKEYFELESENPYMLFTAKVREEKKKYIPAVTHVDGSSRIQALKREDNPLYYDLINEFYKKTGCPVIINTSFNTKSEPMVLTPQDAYRCFRSSEIDCLVLGSFLIVK